MKCFIVILFFAANYSCLFAQQTVASSGNIDILPTGQSPFLSMQLVGSNYLGKTNLVISDYNALPTYSVDGVNAANVYFSNDWVKGSVSTIDNKTYSEGLVFMLDKVHHQLYFKKVDSSIIMQTDMSKVSVFSLITDKQHIFIKGDLLRKNLSGNIFEVLILDEKKFSFLKSVSSVYEEMSGNPIAQAMTQSTGKYVDKPVYYIYNDTLLKKIQLKKKSFAKALGSDESKAELYMQNHQGKFNEAYAINLIMYLNQ